MPHGEAAHDGGEKPFAHGRGAGEPQLPLGFAFLVDKRQHVLPVCDQLPAMVEQRPAGVAQSDDAGGAVEKLSLQSLFHILYGPADMRCRHAQCPRSTNERAGGRDCDKFVDPVPA